MIILSMLCAVQIKPRALLTARVLLAAVASPFIPGLWFGQCNAAAAFWRTNSISPSLVC